MRQGKARSLRGKVGLDTVGRTLAFTQREVEGAEQRSDEIRPTRPSRPLGCMEALWGGSGRYCLNPVNDGSGVHQVEQCTWKM